MTRLTQTKDIKRTPVRRTFKRRAAAGALTVCMVGAITPAQAAPGPAAGCPNVNPDLAISVGAGESEFLKQDAKVILRGDVTIDQGVLHLAADEVIIEYLQGSTRDKGSQGKVNSLLARGTVKIVCENDRAHGGEAFYDVARRTIRLTRDVLLVREDNILKGETLFIDLDTGHMTIEGGGTPMTDSAQIAADTRIKAVFTPAARNSAPENETQDETEIGGTDIQSDSDPGATVGPNE